MEFEDVSTGSTWSWLAASCAAALATLDAFDREPILANVRALEEAARVRLSSLFERHEAIGDVRAIGCFQAIEFVKDRSSKERDLALQARVARRCMEAGLLVTSSTSSLNVQPSLVTPVEVQDRAYDILGEAIERELG
jgi:4-aminobutyrate aminotransferase-like enzyme